MAFIGVTAVGPAEVAQATSYVPISGSGSSWAGPAIDQWASDMEPQGLTINFNPVGSALGRQQFQFDQNDFAASDIAFLTTPDPFQGGIENVHEAYSYVPDVAGGTAFLYNLQIGGRKITNLRLSQTTLMKIFTGQITNWDNPEITSDYGAPLPNLPITVVTRSDGSGASYFLSNWMNTVFPSQWHSFCVNSGGSPGNCGPTEFYPGQHPGFEASERFGSGRQLHRVRGQQRRDRLRRVRLRAQLQHPDGGRAQPRWLLRAAHGLERRHRTGEGANR